MLSLPDDVKLLAKLREATTKDVDEEKGSFKKGDKAAYNMLGGGLTDSDLMRTLGTAEHILRADHDGAIAEIVEAIGEVVVRYSIMFEDSFVIANLATSELRPLVEDKELSDEEVAKFVSDQMSGTKGDDVIKRTGDLLSAFVKKFHLNTETAGRAITKLKAAVAVYKSTGNESKTNEAIQKGDTVAFVRDFHWKSGGDTFGWSSGDIVRAVDVTEEGVYVKDEDTDTIRHLVNRSYLEKVVESKTNEAGIERVSKEAIAKELYGKPHAELTDEEKEKVHRKWINKLMGRESKTNEAEDATDTMKPQEKPNLKAEDCGMEDLSNVDLDKVKGSTEDSGTAIRQVDDKELVVEPDKVVEPKKESKLKEEESAFTPSREEFKKIGDDQLVKLHKNARKSEEYWAKDRSAPEKAQAARDAVTRYEEELVKRGLLTGVEVPESKYSFMSNREPLWLCNECHMTFRNNNSVCTLCESEEVEKISEQTAGFTKEVFQVTWKNTDTGEEESTRVMAIDKADIRVQFGKNPKKELIKMEGPITEEPKEEAKVPFDQDSEGAKLKEGVHELVGNVPGIDKKEQAMLRAAIEDGSISNEWPSEEQIVDALVKAKVDPDIVDDADMEELRQIYLKHILLTKAMQLARVGEAKEFKPITVIEIVSSIVDPEAYNIRVVELPEGDDIVILDTVSDREEALSRGKEFARVLNAKFLGIIDEKKVGERKSREDTLAQEFFGKNYVDLNSDERATIDDELDDSWREQEEGEFQKGYEYAQLTKEAHLNLKTVLDLIEPHSSEEFRRGYTDYLAKFSEKESKTNEQEEDDTFQTIAKGITDREDADKLAKEKEGQVIQDEEDETKFAVLVRNT